MQYFSSLKFHDRWWVRIDIKAFSEAMKMHLTILTDSWRTQAQQGRAGQGIAGKAGSHVPLLLGLSWGTESIECPVTKQITPIFLCQLLFQQFQIISLPQLVTLSERYYIQIFLHIQQFYTFSYWAARGPERTVSFYWVLYQLYINWYHLISTRLAKKN